MSDGRFSSKPIRTGNRSDFTSNASFGKGEFSAEARTSPSEARAFVLAPAVQREVNALLEEPFPEAIPEVGALKRAPFPKKTPLGATELGRPIASAVLAQEYLIGLLFLRVCGWIFMACGVFIVLGSTIVFVGKIFERQRPGKDLGMGPLIGVVVFGVGFTGAGAWFGIFRGRVINQMCWFCPHGMVWMSESVFEWYRWEQVPEVYCKLKTARPAVGIRFDRAVAWISFGNTVASRLIVPYIENRASAACMPVSLQALAEGRTLRFGSWRLHRLAILGPGDDVAWRNVTEIDATDRDLFVRHGERGEMTISLDEVPYPSLFTALARALRAFARERHG